MDKLVVEGSGEGEKNPDSIRKPNKKGEIHGTGFWGPEIGGKGRARVLLKTSRNHYFEKVSTLKEKTGK